MVYQAYLHLFISSVTAVSTSPQLLHSTFDPHLLLDSLCYTFNGLSAVTIPLWLCWCSTVTTLSLSHLSAKEKGHDCICFSSLLLCHCSFVRLFYSMAWWLLCHGYLSLSIVIVTVLERPIDDELACLHELTAHHHLIQDLVNLVEVEHQVQLTHWAKILVQHLHEQVDEFKHGQFVVIGIHAQCEEQSCIPSVDYLMIPEL